MTEPSPREETSQAIRNYLALPVADRLRALGRNMAELVFNGIEWERQALHDAAAAFTLADALDRAASVEKAIADERAAVVAHMRARAKHPWSVEMLARFMTFSYAETGVFALATVSAVADEIERGNHRESDRNPEGEKPQALSAEHESAVSEGNSPSRASPKRHRQ